MHEGATMFLKYKGVAQIMYQVNAFDFFFP